MGLGHEFLRHVERTGAALVLDTAQTEGRDCLEDYEVLRRELQAFNPDLAIVLSLLWPIKWTCPMPKPIYSGCRNNW